MFTWDEMTIEEKRACIAGTWLAEDLRDAINADEESDVEELDAAVGNAVVRLVRAFKGKTDADLDEAVKEVDAAPAECIN